MWQYHKTTGHCIYNDSASEDYESLPEEVISELSSMLQHTNNEVKVTFNNGKLLFDSTGYKKYVNRLKGVLLLESDWMIVRHQEEVISGETPTLSDTEIQELRTKRNKIRKTATIDELLSLEI